MKKITTIIVFFSLLNFKNIAQNVGISSIPTTPDPSAMLDIVSSNTGLLIPRVALTALNVASPVSAPLNSLLVYNTAISGVSPNNVVPGYYYWQSSTNTWVSLSGAVSGSNSWNVLGNAGTTPTINFLGTTDNQDLVFKTNNTEQMRLYNNGIFGNLQGNTVGSDLQGINAKTFSWESPNNGFAATIFNSGTAPTQNALAVKVAGTSSLQTILDLSTGVQNVQGTPVMSVRANGNVGIGTNVPSQKLHVSQGNVTITNNSFSAYTSFAYSGSGSGHPVFMGIAGGGTEASPTYPIINRTLSSFIGRDALDYAAPNYGGAAIYMTTTENFSSTNKGSRIDFITTLNGTNTQTINMTLDHTGNLGIGTLSPSKKLHVIADGGDGILIKSTGNDVGDLIFQDFSGFEKGRIYTDLKAGVSGMFLSGQSTSTANMYLSSNGNVGIGTVSPNASLHVVNTSALTAAAITRFERTGTLGSLFFTSGATVGDWNGLTGNGDKTIIFDNDFSPNVDDPTGLVIGPWNDALNPTGRNKGIKIMENGNVGIGAANPLGHLHVWGGDAIVADNTQNNFNVDRTSQELLVDNIRAWSDNGLRIYDGNSNSHLHIGTTGYSYLQSYNPASISPGVLGTSGIDFDDNANFGDMTLNPLGGNVGVGTTAPSQKLEVNGNALVKQLWIGSGAGDLKIDNAGIANTLVFTTSSLERIRIDNNGSVGIGVTVPTSTLSVNGTADKVGGGSWAVFSDARVKKNVTKYAKGLDYILKIEPVSFEYNGKGGYKADGKTYIGVIAQEIEKILPSTVNKVKTADFEDQRMFDSSELIFTLINSIKELNQKNEALVKTIEDMQKNIDLLKKKK